VSGTARVLVHPLLAERGVRHGFGVRGAEPPDDLWRPRQVHGSTLVVAEGERWREPPVADAVAASRPGRAVGVVTADCVPVLLASARGEWVLAVHAGWRGLAAGVVEGAVGFLRARRPEGGWVAVVGPHVGPCCYEIDAPVVDALRVRFTDELDDALRPTRPAHWRLDLGRLARRACERAGLDPARVGVLPDACTACDPERFHSHRRDGPGAGRLVHFVVAGAAPRWAARPT
jgi:YfiH family protein